MIARILYDWTLLRVIYLLLGGFVIVQSIVDRQWIALLPGLYFAAMGLFRFGCAADTCDTTSFQRPTQSTNPPDQDIIAEEIK